MHTARSIYLKLKGRSVRNVLRNGPEYVRGQLLWAARTRYYRRKLHGNAARVRERRRAALRRLRGEESTVVFACHGNICRSPFAEQYARQRLKERGIDGIRVESTGFIDNAHPRSPPEARAAADRRGVSLDDHRSRQADAQRLDRADLVLVQDYRNYHNYTTRFPEAADQTFLLGVFGDHPEIAVSDPFGEPRAAFENAYDRIAANVDALLDAYTAHADSPETE